MKKIICLILAAAFLLLTGCQANDPTKTYTTDEIIQKIEKNKKYVKSDEDREDLVYIVKTVSKSKPNMTSLATTLGCIIEESEGYKMPFTETITICPAVDEMSGDSYTEASVNYSSDINYIYHCKDKNWTIEIAE